MSFSPPKNWGHDPSLPAYFFKWIETQPPRKPLICFQTLPVFFSNHQSIANPGNPGNPGDAKPLIFCCCRGFKKLLLCLYPQRFLLVELKPLGGSVNGGWEILRRKMRRLGVQPQMVVKDQGYHPQKMRLHNSGLVIIGNFALNYFDCKHEEAIQKVVGFQIIRNCFTSQPQISGKEYPFYQCNGQPAKPLQSKEPNFAPLLVGNPLH